MVSKIFLDLDGVVRDWCRGIIKWYDLDLLQSQISHWGFFEDYVKEHLHMSASEFWEGQTDTFWANLPFTVDAYKILALLKKARVPVYILTSPTLNNAGGSQAWIRKNMPDFFDEKRYLIGPPKYACACPDAILIDDSDKNIALWRGAGGWGYLYPQPWNEKRDIAKRGNAAYDLECYLNDMEVM